MRRERMPATRLADCLSDDVIHDATEPGPEWSLWLLMVVGTVGAAIGVALALGRM